MTFDELRKQLGITPEQDAEAKRLIREGKIEVDVVRHDELPTILAWTYRWSIKLFGERVGFFLGDRAVDLYYLGRGNA